MKGFSYNSNESCPKIQFWSNVLVHLCCTFIKQVFTLLKQTNWLEMMIRMYRQKMLNVRLTKKFIKSNSLFKGIAIPGKCSDFNILQGHRMKSLIFVSKFNHAVKLIRWNNISRHIDEHITVCKPPNLIKNPLQNKHCLKFAFPLRKETRWV